MFKISKLKTRIEPVFIVQNKKLCGKNNVSSSPWSVSVKPV